MFSNVMFSNYHVMVITKLYLLMNIGVTYLGFNEVDIIFAFFIMLHAYLHFLQRHSIWYMAYGI